MTGLAAVTTMSGVMPMQRVRRARAILACTLLGATVLWSGATGLGILALFAVAPIDRMPAIAALFWPLAIAAMLGTSAVSLWRARGVWSLERVALWLEERTPELQYALVTVVDPRYAAGPVSSGERHAALLAAAGRADMETLVRRSVTRTLMGAVAAVLVTGAAVRLLHVTASLGGIGPRRDVVVAPLGNRLTKLRAEIIPPAYSGLPRRTVSDPTTVAGLVGTEILFLGEGPPVGVTAVLDRDTLVKDTLAAHAAGEAGAAWALRVPMPTLPGLIRLQDRSYHRSVVLEPVPDSVPQVWLRQPVRDTTWRWDQPPRGELLLEAELADDYGIQSAFFEILVSTGGVEHFETKDKSTPRVRFGGRRHGTLRATVSYAALGVGQGTVVHIRAVAYDNNTVADSAGKGMSETRTLRIATKGESDTASVTPAKPLPIDSLWMGQRQLNARTDTLVRFRQPKITRQEFVDTSITYADKQRLIRNRVEEVILLLEDDGVGGRVESESSRLLRAASEQMWGARQYLAIGLPDSAYVPPKSYMKEALRLLEEAGKSHKYYLRGVLQVRPIDIAAARLQGTDEGMAAARTPRSMPEDLRRALRRRLAVVVSVAAVAPREAVDSLMRIRAAALRSAPVVAAALQEAIDSAHRGKIMVTPLARAQRLLDPLPQVTAGPVEWGGGMLP